MTTFEHIVRSRLIGLRLQLLSRSGSPEGTEEEVREIDAALLRLAEGTFGLCERCGRALGQQRLGAEPAARFCHACRESPSLH